MPGGWTGTITVHAEIDSDTTETSESGDPGSLYFTTIVSHDVMQADASDEFTVTGTDDEESAVYGIGSVELSGPASVHGTSRELHVSTADKHNALGCHFTDEVGSEANGPWTMAGTGHGEIRFQDDGTYTISIGFSPADPEGDGYETPTLPQTLWETYTILEGAARDCPPTGRTELTDTAGPLLGPASTFLGVYDIEGSIDPSNPPSVVDGSLTFETDHAGAPLTVTATWHLVHDGPIDVTYNEPPPE